MWHFLEQPSETFFCFLLFSSSDVLEAAAAAVLGADEERNMFVNGATDRSHHHLRHPLGADGLNDYAPSPGNSEESYNMDDAASYPQASSEDPRTAPVAADVVVVEPGAPPSSIRPAKFPEYKH